MPGFGQAQGPPAAQFQQQYFPPQQHTMQAAMRAPPQQAYFSPTPAPMPSHQSYYQPPLKVAGVGGAPWEHLQGSHRSKFSINQLRQSDGIVPLQYGTNRFASQKKMTAFGSPRDVNGKHLHRIWDDFYTDDSEPFPGQQQPYQQQYQPAYQQPPPQSYQQQQFQQQPYQQQPYQQQQQYYPQ